MEITKYPDPILTTRLEEITDLIKAADIALNLKNEMSKLTWGQPVGLAANQIGINARVFIAQGEVYINPKMSPDLSSGKKTTYEGCYSLVDNQAYKTHRYRVVRLEWQDLEGNFHEKYFTGFSAHVIQHEYDHLEGRICTNN